MPSHGGVMMAEHMAALALVPFEQATHAAVQDGDWCDPQTWHNRQVPGEGARVVIPAGRLVTYATVSDVSLKTLRVDGQLWFSPSKSTRLRLDTLYIDGRGSLVIGTEDNPLDEKIQAEIIIADNGDIDTEWDPMLLSRGIIAHGSTVIHGAEKTVHAKLDIAPSAGDTVLYLEREPVNWRPGDQLVIPGTQYSGWKWDNDRRDVRYYGTRDEVRRIVAIAANAVTLDVPLEYDHHSPRGDLKARVANFSRNVSITTENGQRLPVHRRGHVMFMHSPAVDVRYAEFRELGRTDKSVPSFEVQNVENVQADSNVRGRYSFHFHRTGTSDQRNPAVAVGNAVFRSPGWGFVHHDSHAEFYQNASFDTFGAGFVAETGNETGTWIGNIAIKAEGNEAFNPKNGTDRDAFDTARTGDGFWFQGRMVRAVDNVAASVNHGYVYYHRGPGMIDFPPDHFMLPEALGYGERAEADDVPIRNFLGNEAFACTVGLFVVKANPMQQHDVYTEISNFTAWEVKAGVAIEYTSHYLLKDLDLVGNTPEDFREPLFGIRFGTNTSDMVVNNARIAGFEEGIRLGKEHTSDNPSAIGRDQFVLINTEFIGVKKPLIDYDPKQDLLLQKDELVDGRFEVDIDGGWNFTYMDPSAGYRSGVTYSGTKVDSIGPNPLPAGGDEFETPAYDMVALLERDGYYKSKDGDVYAIVEQYFSDRATAEIHKYSFKTRLGPKVVKLLGDPHDDWAGAKYSGVIDLASKPPLAGDDSVRAVRGRELVIDVLGNDSDPDGDKLSVDGLVQPVYGRVFSNSDGTLTYRPGINIIGTDRFYYWASDGQGNFARAKVTVEVQAE